MKEFSVTRDENGTWLITSEKLPGFVAKGKTQKEALDKIIAAVKMYFPCGPCKGE